MGFLKRLLGAEVDVAAMRQKGDVVGLIAALDHPTQLEPSDAGTGGVFSAPGLVVSRELSDAIASFGSRAVEPLGSSAKRFTLQAQEAVGRGDLRTAGQLINSQRFRIEVLARIPDPSTIRPLLDAFVDGIETSYVPPAVNQMTMAQGREMVRRVSFSDRPFPQPDMQSVRMQGDVFAFSLPGRWLANAAAAGLVRHGVAAVRLAVRGAEQASPQLRFGLVGLFESIGGVEAKAAVQKMLEDPDEGVRQRAQKAFAAM